MFRLPRIFGSLQDSERFFVCENPLEEVWSRIGRFAARSYIDRKFIPDKPWDAFADYGRMRITQAVEFRNASRGGTILTSPLLLYYAFLNLTRAFLALNHGIMPEKSGHGLRFEKGDHLLECKAVVCKGTFSDYLKTNSIPWSNESRISLREALKYIIEIREDYQEYQNDSNTTQMVTLHAETRGPVSIIFLNAGKDFLSTWKADFPRLSGLVSPQGKNELVINDAKKVSTSEGIQEFMKMHFLPELFRRVDPVWYIYREGSSTFKANRASYYYICMFILGSIVRYEPNFILPLLSKEVELAWLMDRFIRSGERFFPQLKLMELYRGEIYFS